MGFCGLFPLRAQTCMNNTRALGTDSQVAMSPVNPQVSPDASVPWRPAEASMPPWVALPSAQSWRHQVSVLLAGLLYVRMNTRAHGRLTKYPLCFNGPPLLQ